jgi:hypothetical protein
MKTTDLSGPALDWAVAKCERIPVTLWMKGLWQNPDRGDSARFNPSYDWSQGGPIIEREGITTSKVGWNDKLPEDMWGAWYPLSDVDVCFPAPTPLIAAMRCYVAAYVGDEVDVPKELLGL